MHAWFAAAVLIVGLQVAPAETVTITVNCLSPCSESQPESRWEAPACMDYDLDTSLIEAMNRGDRSARDLLQRRYAQTDTWFERQRIGGALLGHVANDRAIWNELLDQATNGVRFSASSPEFLQWCEERQFDPDEYLPMAWNAFVEASHDPRSRPLLFEVLRGSDERLIFAAIGGFASQHDETALPAIEEALERLRDDASGLVMPLAIYKSERADALARKYMDWESEAEYSALRHAAP